MTNSTPEPAHRASLRRRPMRRVERLAARETAAGFFYSNGRNPLKRLDSEK